MLWCKNCQRFVSEVETTDKKTHVECGTFLTDPPEDVVNLEKRGDFWKRQYSKTCKEKDQLISSISKDLGDFTDKVNKLLIEEIVF